MSTTNPTCDLESAKTRAELFQEARRDVLTRNHPTLDKLESAVALLRKKVSVARIQMFHPDAVALFQELATLGAFISELAEEAGGRLEALFELNPSTPKKAK